MIAIVDESIVIAGNGCYALSCVVIPIERKAAVRRTVRKATPGRIFHWTNEGTAIRRAMLGVAAAEAAYLVTYVHRPALRRDHESIRAMLLATLLSDLAKNEVIELLIESRQEHNDLRDRRVIVNRQRSGVVSDELDYRHTGPRQEPLLWLADALAGAVTAQSRKDGSYLAALPGDRLVVSNL